MYTEVLSAQCEAEGAPDKLSEAVNFLGGRLTQFGTKFGIVLACGPKKLRKRRKAKVTLSNCPARRLLARPRRWGRSPYIVHVRLSVTVWQ